MGMKNPEKSNEDGLQDAKAGRPSIFQYLDYRDFLKDMYHYLKLKSHGAFSHRVFSRQAGLGSPNYLKLVIDGNRSLSAKTIQKFGKAFKFNREELQCFEALVFYCKSKTHEEKDYYLRKLKQFKKFGLAKNINQEMDMYFAHWYLPVIREMVALPDFRENPKWIAKRLAPPITPTQAEAGLELLLKLGLLTRNEDQRLVQAQSQLFSGSEGESQHLWNFHRVMISKGYSALKKPTIERDVSCITFPVSPEKFKAIRTLIYDFYAHIEETLQEDKEPSKEIAHINVQFFKLTQNFTKERKPL